MVNGWNKAGHQGSQEFFMSILIERIQQRLDALEITAAEASKKSGMLPDTIRNILVGRTQSPRVKTLEALTVGLECPLDFLLGHKNVVEPPEEMIATLTIPVVDWVEAGSFSQTTEPYTPGSRGQEITVTCDITTLYGLVVKGNSMNRVAPDGSTIIVDYSRRELTPGKYYVIENDSGASFKRYRSDPDRFEPDSTEQHDTIFPNGEITVCGQVIEVRKAI